MISRVGQRLDERYLLTERIAIGGMGEVWKAIDEVLDREVAVKILRNDLSTGDPFRQRFRTEARTAAMLSHPGIAAVFDYGEIADDAYLVMELVPGQPLSEVISSHGALRVDRALDLLSQIAHALHAAHLRGVVHRDVKPANIIVTPTGRVTITDFGIARMRHYESLTATGQVMGTAHYLAPEVARGETATPLSDLYALGVVGYECLSGWRPFDGTNQIAVATAHLREQPPPLPESIPAEIRTVIFQALEKVPAMRPRSCEAFAVTLEGLLRGRGGTVVPPTLTAELAGALAHPSAFRPIPGAAPAGVGVPAAPATPVGAGMLPAGSAPSGATAAPGVRPRATTPAAGSGTGPRPTGGTESGVAGRHRSGRGRATPPSPGSPVHRGRRPPPRTAPMPVAGDGTSSRAAVRRAQRAQNPLLTALHLPELRVRSPLVALVVLICLVLLASLLAREPGSGDSRVEGVRKPPGFSEEPTDVGVLTAGQSRPDRPDSATSGPGPGSTTRSSDGDRAGSPADEGTSRTAQATSPPGRPAADGAATADAARVGTQRELIDVRTEYYLSQSGDAAGRILADRGLAVTTRTQDSDLPEGAVVDVEPTGLLERGSRVTVVVSAGGEGDA
jgi:predicted Ser/Thr protein kinase